MIHFTDLEKYISKVRLNNFLTHCKNDENKALLLYKANIRLSKSFYPLLSILEISLRNSINQAMIHHFGDSNWILNQRVGFMRMIGDNGRMEKLVNKAETSLNIAGKIATNDRIVSELSFGFWTKFYNQRVYRRLTNSPINAFPNIPSTYQSRNNTILISNELNAIREFRNKVYHNETICFDSTGFSLVRIREIYEKIYNVFSWFNPLFHKWLIDIDEVPYELERINHCANNNGKTRFVFNINKLRIVRVYKKIKISKFLYKQKF